MSAPDLKKDAAALHNALFDAFEQVSASGPLAFMGMGLIVKEIRKSLEGTQHAEAPRDARILMFGVDIMEKRLRKKTTDDGTSELLTKAALFYMISVEPKMNQHQRKTFDKLMQLL